MRIVVIQCEGLTFESLYSSGKSDLFYRAMAYQGQNFFNFRYETPLGNVESLEKHLSQIFGRAYYKPSSANDIEKKKQYCILIQDSVKAKKAHKPFQEKCQAMLDRLDDLKVLDDAYVVLMGVGVCNPLEKYKHSGVENQLRDRFLHAPLIIYCPKRPFMDIANSVSYTALVNTFMGLKNNEEKEVLSVYYDPTKRWDIYSHGNLNSKYSIGGLRGPMFQYYAWLNKKSGEIDHHELYDLNNDYSMKKNLWPSAIEGKIIPPLFNEYKNRVEKFLRSK